VPSIQHIDPIAIVHSIELPLTINHAVEYFFNRFGTAELAQLV
jgi:hypothetical protein